MDADGPLMHAWVRATGSAPPCDVERCAIARLVGASVRWTRFPRWRPHGSRGLGASLARAGIVSATTRKGW